MYRDTQVLRSNALLKVSTVEDYPAEAIRGIYIGRQDSTHTTDSSKYLTDARNQSRSRDGSFISSQTHQNSQFEYLASHRDVDSSNSLPGFPSAGSSLVILPNSLKNVLDLNASAFQETPMMASAREEPQHRMISKIPDELICALCGEMYNDPRLLPCLHTFCRRCLEHTVNPRSATITCHSCRKEVSLLVSIVFLLYFQISHFSIAVSRNCS